MSKYNDYEKLAEEQWEDHCLKNLKKKKQPIPQCHSGGDIEPCPYYYRKEHFLRIWNNANLREKLIELLEYERK